MCMRNRWIAGMLAAALTGVTGSPCLLAQQAAPAPDTAVEEIVVRTRQYSVRQERWFRRDPRVRWVDIEHDPVAEVLPVIEGL